MELLENNYGKVRCKVCDSVMKPSKEDVKVSPYGDGHYIICPVCNSYIWLNDYSYERNPVLDHILAGGLPHK